MAEALREAGLAAASGEVPVGAVLVQNNEIVSRGHNLIQSPKQPLNHAELLVLTDALGKLRCKYLYEATLYVTIEPCLMCAGAMVLGRLGTLVFGAFDPKAGAVGSLYNVLADERLNHRVKVIGGIRADECRSLMQDFFRDKRK